MSYILDALKKSDQERQQGNSPNLHSAHGPILPARPSSSPFKRSTFWLISGGVLLFCACITVLFFQFHSPLSEKNTTELTAAPSVSSETKPPQAPPPEPASTGKVVDNATSAPLVTVREQDKVVLSIPVHGTSTEPPTALKTDAQQTSLPYLKDLSGILQAEIPTFHFAGHTYAENPAQRMIIANGKIVREGDVIAPYTYLKEITWEGVVIDYKGTRFRVDTN